MISSRGCQTGKQINRSQNKTAVRRHKSHVQNHLTETPHLPKFGAQFASNDADGGPFAKVSPETQMRAATTCKPTSLMNLPAFTI